MAFQKRGKWWISYRDIPSGRRRQCYSGPCRELAELEEQERQVAWQRFKITGQAPQAEPQLDAELERYLTELEKRGRSQRHIRSTGTRVGRGLSAMGTARPSDLSIDKLEQFLDTLEQGGKGRVTGSRMSAKTVDEHGRALRAFASWLVSEGFLATNPLMRFRPRMVRGRDETYERRGLSLRELRKIAAAVPQRAALYWFAATTGLRAGELRNLRWQDLDLEQGELRMPGWRNKRRQTKNGKVAFLPVQSWVCDQLRLKMQLTEHVFDLPKDTAKMIRDDAQKAGVLLEDRQGRVLDFHSLRCSTFTILKELKVDVLAIRDVMRHAKVETTMAHYDKTETPTVTIPDPRRAM